MEGIYIHGNEIGDDRTLHTGFVVFFKNADYAISSFTACTMPFILKHAEARHLTNPQVYFCLTPLNKIKVGEE
tara:strand:- start:116 stop:334 length:219 start_codon:yes stop_codon:yes gene_type:complete